MFKAWQRTISLLRIRSRVGAFVSTFALAGTVTLLLTHAVSAPSVQIEAEDGRISQSATIVDDTAASKGKNIRFGSSQTGDSGIKFRLFAPAWRGLGDTTQTSRLSHFTEVIGNQDPTSIHNLIPGSTFYKYSLGPYVTAPFVPCSMRPPTYNQPKLADNVTDNPDYNTHLSDCGKTALPSSALAKDQRGYTVWSRGFTDNFLVNTNDTAWVSYLRTNTGKQITFSTGNMYDGLMSDSMGITPICTNYLNAKPIGWSCDSPDHVAQWLAASRQTLLAKKDALDALNKKLIMNGLIDGDSYWSPLEQSRSLLTEGSSKTVVGAMAEEIFRTANWHVTSYRSVSSWLNDVTMIEDLENTYHINGYWWSKCWSSDPTGKSETCHDDGNPDAITQYRRFTISSYLLGAGQHSYFNWDEDKNDGNAAEYYAEYDQAFALGWATSAKTESGTNIYSRQYSGGIVYVNPTASETTITLPSGTYKKFDGTTASGNLSLQAHSGEVLVSK